MSYLGTFGLKLEKATMMWCFTSATLNFSKHEISTKNKSLKFGTKTALIVFLARISRFNVVFEISIFEFVNMRSLIQKQENFKLGTKNTLFGYCWARI